MVVRHQAGYELLPTEEERNKTPLWCFAGIGPNLILITYPALRQALNDLVLRMCPPPRPGYFSSKRVIFAGAVASLIATITTHPLQWYRSRLQASTSHGGKQGIYKALELGLCFDGLWVKLFHSLISGSILYFSKAKFEDWYTVWYTLRSLGS